MEQVFEVGLLADFAFVKNKHILLLFIRNDAKGTHWLNTFCENDVREQMHVYMTKILPVEPLMEIV